MKVKILSLFIIMFAFLSWNVYGNNDLSDKNSIVNQEKIVRIFPNQNVKPGQTVIVEVLTDNKLINPKLVYENKEIKMFCINDNEYRAHLGIDALTKPGLKKLALIDDSGHLSEKAFIDITSANFPIQNIRVSKGVVGLQATAHELSEVNRAKNLVTDKKLMQTPPFDSPTKGCICSIYGLNRYYNGKPSGNYHKGIDIVGPNGQRVNTITNGKVIVAEKFNLHGGTVAVDHGLGIMSIYIHLSDINVKEGQIVSQGQKIGEVGSTGFATGPHLHWGLYVNGVPVDPMQYWIKPVSLCK